MEIPHSPAIVSASLMIHRKVNDHVELGNYVPVDCARGWLLWLWRYCRGVCRDCAAFVRGLRGAVHRFVGHGTSRTHLRDLLTKAPPLDKYDTRKGIAL